MSSSEVETLLHTCVLHSPRVVASTPQYLFTSLIFAFLSILTIPTLVESTFLAQLLTATATSMASWPLSFAPPQSVVHTLGKATFLKCKSDQVAPQLTCCNGLTGRSPNTRCIISHHCALPPPSYSMLSHAGPVSVPQVCHPLTSSPPGMLVPMSGLWQLLNTHVVNRQINQSANYWAPHCLSIGCPTHE